MLPRIDSETWHGLQQGGKDALHQWILRIVGLLFRECGASALAKLAAEFGPSSSPSLEILLRSAEDTRRAGVVEFPLRLGRLAQSD